MENCGYKEILAPEEIKRTIEELDAVIRDEIDSLKDKDAAYKNKSQLAYRKVEIENDIKLTEADAFMNVEGTGKEQYVMVGERRVILGNDTMRDAYRRSVTAKQRKELAAIEAAIVSIESDLQRANDTLYTSKDIAEALRSKAALQAALLAYCAKLEC